MKKFAVILTVSALLLLLAACGGASGSETSAVPQNPASAAESAGSAESSEASGTGAEPTAQASDAATVSVGDLSLAFNQEGEYYALAYRYPDAMELEKDEEKDRDLVRYYVDGLDPYAFGVELKRMKGYSVDELVEDILRLETEISTEEHNGITWTVGTVEFENDDGNTLKATLYISSIEDYQYILWFSSTYANLYDFTDFADAFVQSVTLS